MSKLLSQQKISQQFARCRKLRPEYVEYIATKQQQQQPPKSPAARNGGRRVAAAKDKRSAAADSGGDVAATSPPPPTAAAAANEPDVDLACYETLEPSDGGGDDAAPPPAVGALEITLFRGKPFGVVRFHPVAGARPGVFASILHSSHVFSRRACNSRHKKTRSSEPAPAAGGEKVREEEEPNGGGGGGDQCDDVGTPQRVKRKFANRSPHTDQQGDTASKRARKLHDSPPPCSASSLEARMREAARIAHPPPLEITDTFELGDDVPCASVDDPIGPNAADYSSQLAFLLLTQQADSAAFPMSSIPIPFDPSDCGLFDEYVL